MMEEVPSSCSQAISPNLKLLLRMIMSSASIRGSAARLPIRDKKGGEVQRKEAIVLRA